MAQALVRSLELTHFLSYRAAELKLGQLTALVGPNASGKSNAVAALKLLRDIPTAGLQTALTRRGGFDQLRHRGLGRPYDPAITVHFGNGTTPPATYRLKLGAVKGKRYAVKLETGEVMQRGGVASFTREKGKVTWQSGDASSGANERDRRTSAPSDLPVPEDQSALPVVLSVPSLFWIWQDLMSIEVVEINPTRVREFQDPSSGTDFQPDGSNAASVFESLSLNSRKELVDQLSAIVPGIVSIEPRRYSNKLTIAFQQEVETSGRREFLANQMSDGTLRVFGILLALSHAVRKPRLLVIEEPEVAIHLGALRTLVEILKVHSEDTQILLTTHSAEIVDALDVDSLRVVWSEMGQSRLASVAEHTRDTLRQRLITAGQLLRADALDPATP